MKLYIWSSSVTVGLAIAGVAGAVHRLWWLAAVGGAAILAFTLALPILGRRIRADENREAYQRDAENIIIAIGKAMSGGWNPRRPHDD